MNNFLLEEILDGHSGAKIYKFKDQENDYLIKIFSGKLDKYKLDRIKEICQIYRSLSINSLSFLGHGELDDKYFFLYNYIEGKNLKQIGDEKYNYEEIYNIGVKTGENAKKLKEFTLPKNTNLTEENLDDLVASVNEKYKKLITNTAVLEIMKDVLGLAKIKKLMKDFNDYTIILKNINKKLIHGDIKRSNFMIDETGEFYIIDIESMKISYDVLNFRHQITWILFSGNNKEKEFIRGFLDGLYLNKRPQYFNEQIVFVIMLNFIEHSYKIFKDENKLKSYFEKMKDIISLIDNIDGYII